MITQQVTHPEHIAYGDGVKSTYLATDYPETTVIEVFVNDWRGNNIQYTTARTNYVDSAIFSGDTSLSVGFINGPTQTGIDAPDGSNDAVRCWALPENLTFDVTVNDAYIDGDNDFNGLFTGTNKIVLASTNATITNGSYFFSFYYRLKLGSSVTIISPETGDAYTLNGNLNEWTRKENIPVNWAGGNAELNITIQNNEGAIIDFFLGQIEFTQTTPAIKTLTGPVTTIDYAAVNNSIIFSNAPLYGADITWIGNYSYEAFDFNKTIISQYANSKTINQLIYNMSQYLDPTVDIKAFYDYVWNVDTAQGFGLDIWGRIVDIKRQLEVNEDPMYAGFYTGSPDWKPMGEAPFYAGETSKHMLTLSDRAYRTLILAKALSNITICSAPAINQLLQNLFPGRGRSYSNDMGKMRMRYTFEFALLPFEIAVVNSLNILPHGAGVNVSVLQITFPFMGFNEQGYGVTTMSFVDTNAIGIAGNAFAESSAEGEITLSDPTQINRTFWGDFDTNEIYGLGDHNWKNAPILDGTATVALISDGGSGYYAGFTVNANEQRAQLSMMQNAVNVGIVENENSGGQIYEFSVMLDSTWQAMTTNGYANIIEMIALDRSIYAPAWAIDIHNLTATLFFGDVVGGVKQNFNIADSAFPVNTWLDFRISVDYKKTATGSFKVEKKVRSAANYTTVLDLINIQTLQYSSLINGGIVPDHVMHIGLYRSVEDFTSIVYHDRFSRNTSGIGALHGAGDSITSGTGAVNVLDYVAGAGNAISAATGQIQFDDLPLSGRGDAVSSASGQLAITQPVSGSGSAISSATGAINIQTPSNITFYGGFDLGVVSAPGTNNQNWYGQSTSQNASIVVQAGNGSTYSAKFTVPPSGTTSSEAAMVNRFQNNFGAAVYENASSGTQVYKFSTMFDASWQPMTSTSPSGRWAIIMRLMNTSLAYQPNFVINVGDSGGAALTMSTRGGNQNIVTSATRVFMSDQTLPKSVWIDWVLTINFTADNTGFAHLDRKNPGETTFTRVAAIDNVPILQWNNANPATGDYYMEMGVYRGPQDVSTSILSIDGFTREPYAVTSTVTVPNIVGMASTAANAALTGAGLLVGTVTNQGLVISQTPAAGIVVNSGSAVDYTMSISAITVTSVSPTSQQISFTFNEVSQAQIEYGITASYGSLTTKETSFNYSTHAQTITGLASNQTYHYRIHGWNQAGLESISNDLTFTTALSALACVTTPTSPTVVSVMDRGAAGNGVVDDTNAIQLAINEVGGTGGTLRIPAGTYMIRPATGLLLKSAMNIEMDTGAIIKAIPYSAWASTIGTYSLFKAQSLNTGGVTNTNILGGQLVGERGTHPPKGIFIASVSGTVMTVTAISFGSIDIGNRNSKLVSPGTPAFDPYTYAVSAVAGSGPNGTTPTGGVGRYNLDINNGTIASRQFKQFDGQHGFGLNILGSKNIFVEGLLAKDCWGDGFYIGGALASNIKLCSVIADNNVRQGISITWADGVYIKNSTFKNTNGNDPGLGIDLEPNQAPAASTVNNVQITDCLVQNNGRAGIAAVLPNTATSTFFIRNTLIERCIIEQNKKFCGAVIQTSGQHIMRDNIIRNNVGTGIIYDRAAAGGSITGNTIYSNTSSAGIVLTASTTNNTVSGNVTNTGAAVIVQDLGTNNVI